MYHISNDERAKKSAKKIGNGLLLCLSNKNFTEITVTDVQKASNVGRATFYRLFDNITDVLSYLCDKIFEKVGREFENMGNCNSKETSLKFIQEWMNNKTLLNAIVNCNRMDILYNSHAKYVENNVDFFFPGFSLKENQINYLMMTMTSFIPTCLTAWIKNGAHETAEQIHSQFINCFNILHQLFEQ